MSALKVACLAPQSMGPSINGIYTSRCINTAVYITYGIRESKQSNKRGTATHPKAAAQKDREESKKRRQTKATKTFTRSIFPCLI